MSHAPTTTTETKPEAKDRASSVAVIKSIHHAADAAIRRSKAPIKDRLAYAEKLTEMATEFARLDATIWEQG